MPDNKEDLKEIIDESKSGPDPFSSWKSPGNNILYGWRSKERIKRGSGNTEGDGLYLSKDEDLASVFGTPTRFKFITPKNPLVVNEEPLYLLHEMDKLVEPITDKDSTWTKLNKTAMKKATEKFGDDWSKVQPMAGSLLTQLAKNNGYDSFLIISCGDQWVVLFDPKIINNSYKEELKEFAKEFLEEYFNNSDKLNEAEEKDLYIGYIDPETFKVHGERADIMMNKSGIQSHWYFIQYLNHNIKSWQYSEMPWRYRKDTQTLYWWDRVPNNTYREEVEDWIEKNTGTKVKHNSPIIYDSPSYMSSHLLRENIDYEAYDDYRDRRDYQLDDLATFLKNSKGKGHVPWNKIPANKLKRIWLDYGKTGVVRDEKGLEQIADLMLNNIARLRASTDMMDHSEHDVRPELEDNGYIFTDEQWNEWMSNVFTDKEHGNWMLSDYGLPKLENLYVKIYNADTPEKKIFFIDQALNVVHQRSDLANMFVEGGSSTLTTIANQGGYTSQTPDK